MENESLRGENETAEQGGFATWLADQVTERGWSLRELGRRSGLSGASVSAVAQGKQKPGLRFCVQIAGALALPPEAVLRRAGLLPPLPPAVAEEQEAIVLLRQLSPASRGAVVMQLRAMAASLPPAASGPRAEAGAVADDLAYELAYDPGDQPGDHPGEQPLERQLLEEFRHLPEEWQTAAIEEIERLQRFSQIGPRFIGDEDDEETSGVQDTV